MILSVVVVEPGKEPRLFENVVKAFVSGAAGPYVSLTSMLVIDGKGWGHEDIMDLPIGSVVSVEVKEQ